MKKAVVTGASRGIGKAIAEAFACEGYHVIAVAQHAGALIAAAEEMSLRYHVPVIPQPCDLRDRNAVVSLFSAIDTLDVLVNNAGVNSRQTIDMQKGASAVEDMLAGWDDEIAVNLTAPYLCSYLAAQKLRNGGVIVNISSVKGIEPTSSPGYGASKAGLIHLTKSLAKALAPAVRVNCIVAGFIDTGMTAELAEERREMYRRMIPSDRFGTAEEVAKAAVFLASENAQYMTGAVLNVSGGYLM